MIAFTWLIVGLFLFPSQQSVEYHPRMVDHNAELEELVFKQTLQCVYFKLHHARQHMGLFCLGLGLRHTTWVLFAGFSLVKAGEGVILSPTTHGAHGVLFSDLGVT